MTRPIDLPHDINDHSAAAIVGLLYALGDEHTPVA